MATRKQPFSDRAHDTRLIIDICNGIKPNAPDIMLDWIPQCYSDLMYKCWNGDPSKRPTSNKLLITYDMDSKESQECIDWKKKFKTRLKRDHSLSIRMPQEKKIVYCPTGHSSNNNYINTDTGYCNLCNKEQFIQEFGIWSSGYVEIDEVIQEYQTNYQKYYNYRLQWIPYDNFQSIKHIATGGYGSVYSAILKTGIKWYWNFNKQVWEYSYIGSKVALKEINDSRNDISEFLKEVKNLMIANEWYYVTKCIGITKKPSTQNYIIVMQLHDDSLHKFLKKNFGNLRWKSKIEILHGIASGLIRLHENNLVHRDLHSGNILIKYYTGYIDSHGASITDLGLCRLENDLILKSENKSNNIYGSVPYIPPEVLRGNAFTKKGDIYSFGGIMYEIATGKQPFYDQAHDTRLIIDICNGVRQNVSGIMLDQIPQYYLDLMYKCWSGDPSERPTAEGLYDAILNFYSQFDKLSSRGQIDNNILKLKIESLSSSESHPQSCYNSRSIHTLHGLRNSLEDIKTGKSQDPNLLKSNEPTIPSVGTYNIDSKESHECIDWEKEIQNEAEKRPFSDISTLDCNSRESKEFINFINEDNITSKKIKKIKKNRLDFLKEIKKNLKSTVASESKFT
ncbi:hypothetical protein Glove_54g25 [Diversispora epigaea]|uniref:Protein kinase domain-containing protein n=1 Tax=Diversispora epigaea TaxID=1348612 RepID=A0A397JJK0_9GLOM|nr:hypothetical protein Glove_54g25 [Diversispora epigaea]